MTKLRNDPQNLTSEEGIELLEEFGGISDVRFEVVELEEIKQSFKTGTVHYVYNITYFNEDAGEDVEANLIVRTDDDDNVQFVDVYNS